MAIVLHPLADLSNAWPPFFVDNLLEVYKHGKSGLKFQMLRNLLVRSLPRAPPPGPATFIVNCLEILQHIGSPHNEGLSHMMISAFCESDRSNWSKRDDAIARKLAGSLFCKALSGRLHMEPRIVVKLPAAFNFDLRDLGEILSPEQSEEVVQWKAAKDFVECYTVQLLKRRLYSGAVSLMKSFDFQTCNYQALIATMVDQGQADMAIDCAAYVGKDMLKFLVQHCTDSGFSKVAYKVVNQYKLKEEFPDTYYLYKKSCLGKLVAKGLWKVAQSIAKGDAVLIDYLVMLAIEDKDAEMVEELSELFNLGVVPVSPDTQINNETSPFLQLESLMSIDNVHWIDTHEKLQFAERALFGVKLVGIDCEWKPDSTKSVAPSKVSILQVASSELVLVLDLITLLKECQRSLVSFIKYLFHSPDIVKLGYAIHNDLARLSRSYKEVDAFALCESVLDLRPVFGGRIKGGLSGLAKEILGSSLNKRTQMSNWETRPLSKKQLHYAALDAAVLLPIFNFLPEHSTLTSEVQGAGPHLTRFGGKTNTGSSDITKEQSHIGSSHEDLQTAYKNNTYFQAKRSNAGGMEQACMNLTRITSHEDLVLASCELLGIPIPGLMKNELFDFTRAAKLMPPAYTTRLACHKEAGFYSFVRLANTTYLGRLASTKKDAEFWAAHVALSKVSIEVNSIGDCSTNGECITKGLSILQACSTTSRSGCLHMLNPSAKHNNFICTGVKSAQGYFSKPACFLRLL